MTSQQWTERPTCPFCSAAWSDAMMAQYDLMSAGNDCACCGGHAGHAPARPVASVPASDLCCASCGRAIFRASA